MRRTHHLQAIRTANEGETVILQGWVHRLRNLGHLSFLDLRDQYGVVQVVATPEQTKNLKVETVIEVQGAVRKRLKPNLNLPTGDIEIAAKTIKIINQAQTLPFVIDDNLQANEETRLKYRYLDLRRPIMKERIIERTKINQSIRQYLTGQEFLEIETPFLTRSTPEGARDFLVASRLKTKHFYALPQSPQLLKQLLMVAGFDRYFQIVRSFRDEDLRLDRQPEFTQLDIEMAFATPEDVMREVERLMHNIFKKNHNVKLKLPLPRISYETAMNQYGTDKPDLRFDLRLYDVKAVFKENKAPFFSNQDGITKAIFAPELLSKKQLTTLEEAARQHHLKGFSFLKYHQGNWSGSLASSLSDHEKSALLKQLDKHESGTILIGHGNSEQVLPALGLVRNQLGKLLNLVDPNRFELLWVTDFPLYEWSEEENRYVAAHNPFTMPHPDSIKDFDKNFRDSKAQSYDLVINGFEIGSGAQRISDPKLQKRMFKALKFSSKNIEKNFGWFVKAYDYGAPYHSGIGIGLDRLAMILRQTSSIRDVIAFPKNSLGQDLMMEAPTKIDKKQLNPLGIKLGK